MTMANLRLDRLATTCFCHPLTQAIGLHEEERRIPILMYHAVREGFSGMSRYYETHVSPRVFASQMRQLRGEGFRALSLEETLESLDSGSSNQKSVVITFDDGYRDFYDRAFPVLAECGLTATLYLATAFVGNTGGGFNGKECLTWSQVRELHSQGISIGSHTVTHPKLKDLKMDHVEEEIASSKKAIEDQIGAPVRSFSYPFAFPETHKEFKQSLREALQNQGYEHGVTTIIGTASRRSDRFFLPRLPVNTWDDPRFFRAKLEGGYNWVHGAQYLAKLLGGCAHPGRKKTRDHGERPD